MDAANIFIGCLCIALGITLITVHKKLYSFFSSRVESRLDSWFLGSFQLFRFETVGLGAIPMFLDMNSLYGQLFR